MFGADTMAMINAVLPFFLMGGIFYFMLWKPQKKQQQDRQNLLNSLKKGDKIITIGGIYGTITDLSEKTVKVEIAEGVEITMVRSAVSNFQDPNRTQSESCQILRGNSVQLECIREIPDYCIGNHRGLLRLYPTVVQLY